MQFMHSQVCEDIFLTEKKWIRSRPEESLLSICFIKKYMYCMSDKALARTAFRYETEYFMLV